MSQPVTRRPRLQLGQTSYSPAKRTRLSNQYSRMLHLEILEGRQLLAGTVMAEIDSYPSQVMPGQLVDLTVRVKFTGDDNDGPWLVTDLDLRDDDDGISTNNDDPLNIYQNIHQKDGPLTIMNQGEWYYDTFAGRRLSTFDDRRRWS